MNGKEWPELPEIKMPEKTSEVEGASEKVDETKLTSEETPEATIEKHSAESMHPAVETGVEAAVPVVKPNEEATPKKKSHKKWWIIGGTIVGVVVALGVVALIGLKVYVDFLESIGAESRFGEKMRMVDGRAYFGDSSSDCGEDEYLHCSVTADPYSWCYCDEKEYDSSGRQIYTTDKPILYLYPEAETEVSVRLGRPEILTVTYPKYQGAWRVLARPDGSLVDLGSGRDLYALYWENQRAAEQYQPQAGFVVRGEDAATFLEEKLAILGLNAREAEEFIVYWLPKLEKNAYNFVYFATAEEIEREMPIEVEGAEVNTEIRVRMVYQGFESEAELLDGFRGILDENGQIPEEKLTPAPTREGFVLVEWGGTEL